MKLGLQSLSTTELILFANASMTGQPKVGARLQSNLNGYYLMTSRVSVGKGRQSSVYLECFTKCEIAVHLLY
jgi:hypothetical protein